MCFGMLNLSFSAHAPCPIFMNSWFDSWTTLKKKSQWLVISMLLSTLTISNSTQAAQKIYVSYSAFERSISIKGLEDYAKRGVIDEDLAGYKKYLKRIQPQQLQQALLSPIKINPVAISQFLYTPQGEFLLRRLGEVIKTETRQPQAGLYALRSSLILASAEHGGLTLSNVLRLYPSSSIYIDLERAMRMATELENLVNETTKAIAKVSQESYTEAAAIQQPLSFSQLPDLSHKGKFASQKQTLKLFDTVRGRFLLTDIYLPYNRNRAPVIVISHGLGSDSTNFEYLATHLSSYGFAVIVPNHPGSDSQQFQSVLNGSDSDLAKPDEFYNRPLDVKYILDVMEAQNKSNSQFRGRLNLQQIGVFGQSFGGYTALALAGAKINFEQLKKDCKPELLKNTWNASLLLQCRVLELHNKHQDVNLQDNRVKAVIAVNPLTSSILGEAGLSQIHTPVMIVASSQDTIAPALYEQIRPFHWIANSQKYLVVLSGGTHFSVIGTSKGNTRQLPLPSNVVGNALGQARRYMNVLSLPFFEAYVVGNSRYTSYLNAAYAKAISHQSLGLSLVRSFDE